MSHTHALFVSCSNSPQAILFKVIVKLALATLLFFVAHLVQADTKLRSASFSKACLSDCTSRIGIVSAFGAEADILLAQTQGKREWQVNGNRFTTGVLRGNTVVIVLSGVSMINATMVTQLMLDHFRVERLLMSGIAGGVSPQRHVGDVLVPERWAMPMEVYWSHDASAPAPCGKPADVSCLGLKLAMDKTADKTTEGEKPKPSFQIPSKAGAVPTGLFMRENFVMHTGNAPKGEFVFDYVVDPAMLAVVKTLKPKLERCGPKDTKQCVTKQPELKVVGRAISGTAFLANPSYREYLYNTIQAEAVDMETAAVAHVAYANRIPFIGFRSLSDLAGAHEFDKDVSALFSSGLAENNASSLTLAFLEAWKVRAAKPLAKLK
jgi:adenosylhomocysteine nucleosidase